MVASSNHSAVKEEGEEEELFVSSFWLYVAILLASFRCLCWALLLRQTNCACFFCNFLLNDCIIGLQLAFSIWASGYQIHCSFSLALLYLPMSLDSRKKEKWDSETYYVDKVHWKWNKTYIHLIHLTLAEKGLQIWVFMMQSKAVLATGLSRQICHGFSVSVGIGLGIGGWYREYVKNWNVAINWRHAKWL